jgi:hypothetical protein
VRSFKYRAKHVVFMLGLFSGGLLVGVYMVLSDADRYMGITSRPLVTALGVIVVAGLAFEIGRWVWRLWGRRPALLLSPDGLEAGVAGPPLKHVLWTEVESVHVDRRTLVIITPRKRIRLPLLALEGGETPEGAEEMPS